MKTQNRLGWTPLHIASEEGHEETARVLLDAGADVNGEKGQSSPLVWAVMSEKRNLKLVKLLIDRGAKANQPLGFDGKTP